MTVTRGHGPSERKANVRRSIVPLPLPDPRQVAGARTKAISKTKTKRPSRWRGPNKDWVDSPMKAHHDGEPYPQLKQTSRPSREQNNRPSSSRNVELRFSFTSDVGSSSSSQGWDTPLNRSFTGLSFVSDTTEKQFHARNSPDDGPQGNGSTSKLPTRDSMGNIIPVLSKPKKKREGYGFSFSDTFMCDSDEYPDTEGESEPEQESRVEQPANTNQSQQRYEVEQITPPFFPQSLSKCRDQEWIPTQQMTPEPSFSANDEHDQPPFSTQQIVESIPGGFPSSFQVPPPSQPQEITETIPIRSTSNPEQTRYQTPISFSLPSSSNTPWTTFHASPPTTATTTPTQSFHDQVVLRDTGSFHLARPQPTLSCTPATREDTMRLKNIAQSLMKYAESPDIQAQLTSRIERMVYAAQQQSSNAPLIIRCALRLRDFLRNVRDMRVDTGEHRTLVEHEEEWAEWLVEASRTGVMHVRGEGCRCRPDWES